MKCVLCRMRAGKRYCPGVSGYICPLCCGTEREVSIECPFDCPHLQQGHRNELERSAPPAVLAHASHEVPRSFVEENSRLVSQLAITLLTTAVGIPGLVDADFRDALDSLIRTYETSATGLVYETLPQGPSRVALYRAMLASVDDWRRRENEQLGVTRLRDGDVLRSLVFLRRLAQTHESPRPRSKLFYSYLRDAFPQLSSSPSAPVIVP